MEPAVQRENKKPTQERQDTLLSNFTLSILRRVCYKLMYGQRDRPLVKNRQET